MAISEADISILIPTYRYKEKVIRAVTSALASGAGEIIVLDDHSRDGTLESLAQFSDPRLIVRENAQNLGLWENHLRALEMASRPWIKFIQADDYLLPGGLAAFAAGAADGVSVVYGVPTLRSDETGATWFHYALSQPRRVAPPEFQAACVYMGWLLGSPSYVMLRADAVERDPLAWRTSISTDLVVGSIAATRGDVVLLPPGAIGHGAHKLQDSHTQNALLGLSRTANSLAYLRDRPEPGLRALANSWTYLDIRRAFRTAGRGIVRREAPPMRLVGAWLRLAQDLSLEDWRDLYGRREQLKRAATFRKTVFPPFDLDRWPGTHT